VADLWAAGGCWAAVEIRPAEGAAVDFRRFGQKQCWAESESRLRPTLVQKVGGERDKGPRADFCGWPGPNRKKGLFIFRI
jgi:hypothetical protein